MMEFEKGENIVMLDDDMKQVHLSFSLKVKDKTTSHLVQIPAFNIHFYVKDRQEIEKSAHESLVSFFNFWIHKKTMDHFLQHMLSLGFILKNKSFGKAAEPPAKYGHTKVTIDHLILS